MLSLLGQEAPGVLCQIIPLSPHRLERCHKAFVPGTTAPSGSGPGASSVFLAASDNPSGLVNELFSGASSFRCLAS